MQILILSDSHGYVDSRILDFVADSEYVIHAGDICGAHVLQDLHGKHPVIAVRGNNDHPSIWNQQERTIIEAIPEVNELQLPGGLIRVEHGHKHGFQKPDHELLRQAHPQAKLIVYGHTHKQILDQTKFPWIINPGASGQTRTHGGPRCIILLASEQQWQIELKHFPQ